MYDTIKCSLAVNAIHTKKKKKSQREGSVFSGETVLS